MNRLELLSLFLSLDRLCEKDDFEGVKIIVKELLSETRKQDNTRISEVKKNEQDIT